MSEPISVRIARAKGCSPGYYGSGHLGNWEQWRCNCREAGHHPNPQPAILVGPAEHEAWLAPAASFALLAEMVEGNCQVATWKGKDGIYRCCFPDDSSPYRMERAPTLAEAIAEAYLAWREAP